MIFISVLFITGYRQLVLSEKRESAKFFNKFIILKLIVLSNVLPVKRFIFNSFSGNNLVQRILYLQNDIYHLIILLQISQT
jgi:hypothetical protein